MHPAPNLAEAPVTSDQRRVGKHQHQQHQQHQHQQQQAQQQQQQQQQQQPPPLPPPPHHQLPAPSGADELGNGATVGSHAHQVESGTLPARKDTTSSISTTATGASLASLASSDTGTTAQSVEASPNYAAQAVFSVKDGSDIIAQRRASRRRTGPLSSGQRERAALIRKLGACADCRRRRVACHPNHLNLTSWEEAARKYKSHSPAMPELAPSGGRPLSQPPLNSKPVYTQDPQEMDLDTSPSQQPGRLSPNESRIRKPLPSAPRLEKINMLPQPAVDSLKPSDQLQSFVSGMLMHPHRSRYSAVSVLLCQWEDDQDPRARGALQELRTVLDQCYNYTFQIKSIPPPTDECKSSEKWLSRELYKFIDAQDSRDVLKIVYYNGHSYLDGDREMVLASSNQAEPAAIARWSSIQPILESATADTLVIMDSPYYPSSKLVRKDGVLEIIAAPSSEDHAKFLDRCAFTRALTEQLRIRAGLNSMEPLTAAELHAKLMSLYPRMIKDRLPEEQVLTGFPSPLHVQVSGNSRLPSILLAPIRKGSLPFSPESPTGGSNMNISFRLGADNINLDSWIEWLRSMPEGVRGVKVDGPTRNTFQ
ncbi:hypothetical protein B0T19DRAFT_348802 [Cercophora scortea]|uniref:Uncharacterized protein n=1 Tax=Cercophora scortea TaxID=314031 RepID=A0AAE0J2E1_9PEZI|nr:hypothetical protein B0T19DRAFT_348802 [Cercophora scortea]